jgi:hypothetical protein
MNTKPFTSGLSGNAVTITRVADRQWHALYDDLAAQPVSSSLGLVR